MKKMYQLPHHILESLLGLRLEIIEEVLSIEITSEWRTTNNTKRYTIFLTFIIDYENIQFPVNLN